MVYGASDSRLDSASGPGVSFVTEGLGVPRTFSTGVPLVLLDIDVPIHEPVRITDVIQLQRLIATGSRSFAGFVGSGFFANGGEICYVMSVDRSLSLSERYARALQKSEDLDEVDLVCAPDIWNDDDGQGLVIQQTMVQHCDMLNTRLAILDSHRGASLSDALEQWRKLAGKNAALYHPWITSSSSAGHPPAGFGPPCGHIAGLIARVDRNSGTFKAPANEVLREVAELQTPITSEMQEREDPQRVVNCLRIFPNHEVRVWGARTISGQPEWRNVSVRRVLITLARWASRELSEMAFEPNTPSLWARIQRRLSLHCEELYRRGALMGQSSKEAFFVRCNAQTNSTGFREMGQMIAEVGLAINMPAEFITVYVSRSSDGVRIVEQAVESKKEG